MKNLKEKIQQARPKLYRVAPLTASIIWGYAVTNILIGIGLFFLYSTTIPIAVTSIFSYQIWGIIFFILGLIKIYSMVSNRWELARKTLLMGLGVKTIWAIALIIRCLASPQTVLITLIWFFFAYIQAVTYVNFIPSKILGTKNAA